MNVQLTGVPETLLITVRIRAIETQRPDGIVKDPYAVDILSKLALSFTGKKSKIQSSSQVGTAIRTILFDGEVNDFLYRNPDGIVVNLGCGLDARRFRLNYPNQWFDIDFEEVISIRQEFFKEDDHYKMISKSMLDYSWMDEVPKDKPLFVIFEGVSMYIEEEALKQLIRQMYSSFKKLEVAFDTIPTFMAKRTKLHSEVKKYNAQFKFGLDDEHDLLKWDDRISIFRVKYYADYYRKRWTLGMRMMMTFIPFFRKANKIVHLN